MASNHRIIKIVAIALFVVLCIVNSAIARPKQKRHTNPIDKEKWDGCDQNNLELCQQCAKRTKSNIVYPLCCNDQDGALKWCKAFLSYGIH